MVDERHGGEKSSEQRKKHGKKGTLAAQPPNVTPELAREVDFLI
jgi:hypothetical protein